MDPINRLSRLMETLRQQMAESAKKVDGSSRSTETKATTSRRTERPSIEKLRARIEERVATVPAIDPDERRRQARRIFLESVIAWEFGDELLLDGQFSRLIDNLQESFAADPEIDRELDILLGRLAANS